MTDEENLLKSLKLSLIKRINLVINESGLTKTEAAKKIEIDLSRLYKILNGNTEIVTIDKLTVILFRLGEITSLTFKKQNEYQTDPK